MATRSRRIRAARKPVGSPTTPARSTTSTWTQNTQRRRTRGSTHARCLRSSDASPRARGDVRRAAVPRLRRVFDRIDHVGVAVEDLDVALELYRDRLGMREQHRETVEQFGVEAALVEVGEGHVELLEPTTEESAVGRFLARN